MQQMHVDLHARLGAVLALNVWRLGAAICARMHRSFNVYCAWHCSPARTLGLLVWTDRNGPCMSRAYRSGLLTCGLFCRERLRLACGRRDPRRRAGHLRRGLAHATVKSDLELTAAFFVGVHLSAPIWVLRPLAVR